jgi:hypothetical protein
LIAFGSVDARICTKRTRSSGSSDDGGTPSPDENSPNEPPATENPPGPDTENPPPPGIVYKEDKETLVEVKTMSEPDSPADPQYTCPAKSLIATCVKGQKRNKYKYEEVSTQNGVVISTRYIGSKYCCEPVTNSENNSKEPSVKTA